MTTVASILVQDQSFTDDDVEVLVAEFASLGIDIDLRTALPRRSIDDVAWYLIVSLPLQPFLTKLVEEFAVDAHDKLRSVLTRIVHRRHASPETDGTIVIHDDQTGIDIVLGPDLPVQAYTDLINLDLSRQPPGGKLRYNRQAAQWAQE